MYIESLCPDSKAFVVDQLLPTFNALANANPPILTVNIVPFGNAQMTFNKHSTKNPSLNFTCQHKDQECVGNIIEVFIGLYNIYHCQLLGNHSVFILFNIFLINYIKSGMAKGDILEAPLESEILENLCS